MHPISSLANTHTPILHKSNKFEKLNLAWPQFNQNGFSFQSVSIGTYTLQSLMFQSWLSSCVEEIEPLNGIIFSHFFFFNKRRGGGLGW